MKNLVVCMIAASVAFAAPGSAQTFGFGAHAGVSIPTGDYGDSELGAAEPGFSGGLDLVYPLLMVTPGLGWYTSADVIAHSVDDDELPFEVDGGYLYVPIMTGLRYDFGTGRMGVFVNGQAGLVLSRPPEFEAGDEAKWGTDFGFVLGGGVRLTENFYAGLKYYPLDIDFKYEGEEDGQSVDVNFLDIYVGFGVF